jgi:4'-phosphopantetheinyl transferase
MNLSPGEVHIWSAAIDERFNKLSINTYLSENEKERGRRFSYDIDSYFFSVRHCLLRIILGHYLQCPPAEIRFINNHYQKPTIVYPDTSIQFNTSVSSNRFVAAFCQHQSIGVDIEQIRQIENINQLSKDYFTPNEAAWVYTHSESMLETAFFSIWSKKEAFVKATGQGLNIHLNTFDILSKKHITFNGNDWHLSPIPIFDDCAAAIAINSPTSRLSYYNCLDLI